MIGVAVSAVTICPICGHALAHESVVCGGVKRGPFGLKRLAERCLSTQASRAAFVRRRERITAAVAADPESARRGEIVLSPEAS